MNIKPFLFFITLSLFFSCQHPPVYASRDNGDELYGLGVALFEQGDFKKALSVFEKVRKEDAAAYGQNSSEYENSSRWLSECYRKLGREKKANSISLNDYELIDRRRTVVSDSLYTIGKRYFDNGDIEKALDYYIKCAALEKENLGELSWYYGNSLINIMYLYTVELNSTGNTIQSSLFKFIPIIEELIPIFKANPSYASHQVAYVSFVLSSVRDSINSVFINVGRIGVIETFYKDLIELFSTTKYLPFLSVGDMSYARMLEEYVRYLIINNDPDTAQTLVEVDYSDTRLKDLNNANYVLISIIREKFKTPTDINTFSRILQNLCREKDLTDLTVRKWVEDRLSNNKHFFDDTDNLDLWIEIAQNCIKQKKFKWTENCYFSKTVADYYYEERDYNSAKTIYKSICSSSFELESDDYYYCCTRLANIYSSEGNYDRALAVLKQLEDDNSLSPNRRVDLYKDIMSCYLSINDEPSYIEYRNKTIELLTTMVYGDFYSIPVDASDFLIQTINAYKRESIKDLYRLYEEGQQWDECIKVYEYLQKYGEENDDCSDVYIAKSGIANCYGLDKIEDFPKSIECYKDCINYLSSLNYSKLRELDYCIGTCYGGIAIDYRATGEPELAAKYSEIAVPYFLKYLNYLILHPRDAMYAEVDDALFRLGVSMAQHLLGDVISDCRDAEISYDIQKLLSYAEELFNIAKGKSADEVFECIATVYSLAFDASYEEETGTRLKYIKMKEDLLPYCHDEYRNELMLSIAENYQDLGLYEKALPLFQRRVNEFESKKPNNHYGVNDYFTSKNTIYHYTHPKGDLGWIDFMKDYYNSIPKTDYTTRFFTLRYAGYQLERYLRGDFDIEPSIRDKCNQALLDIRIQSVELYSNNKYQIFNGLLKESDIKESYLDIMEIGVKSRSYDIIRKYYSDCMRFCLEASQFEILFFGDWADESHFSSTLGNGIGELIALEYGSKSVDLGIVYNTLLFRKNANLIISTSLDNIVKESTDSLVIEKYNRILEYEKAISTDNIPERYTLGDYLHLIDRYKNEIKMNTSYLIDYANSVLIDFEKVQSGLNEKEIAIEFTRFEDSKGEPQYAALVLAPKGNPVFYYIGNEDKISNLSYNSPAFIDELYDCIWEPLKDALKGIRAVYFSPDGLLHNLPLEIGIQKDGSRKIQVYRVSSTKELLSIDRSPQEFTSAVLYGGLMYGRQLDKGVPADKRYTELKNADMPKFDYLKESSEEVETIQSTMSSKNIQTCIYTLDDGTEVSFKELSNKENSVIHIATHGFYVPKKESYTITYASYLDSLLLSHEDLSLMRSGLIMSEYSNNGVSSIIPGYNDGILTAYEISKMDLHKVNFIVLSGCETGLGDINGDGVFGLQRGFKKAGAKSILMSLWPIDDTATKILMNSFYNSLISGFTKQESLVMAQQTLKEYAIDSISGEPVNPTVSNAEAGLHTVSAHINPYSAPVYWSGFILLDALN